MPEHNPWEGTDCVKLLYWRRNLTADLQKPLSEEDRKWAENELSQIREALELKQSA